MQITVYEGLSVTALSQYNALHQLPPPNVFLWSAPEPCSPLGKWLDWVPPKRYQDTTHTTQHRWDQLLLLNHS